MKAIAVFLLFVGMFLIVQGYYQRKNECPAPAVQVKYVPRSVYEDQLAEDSGTAVTRQFKSLFEDVAPWPTALG